jgi:aldehyde:ferredoxin oxidoreductase
MKYLKISLNEGIIESHPITDDILKSFLGGRGFGIWYLSNHIQAKIDPLSPHNILSIWSSPLIGTGALSMVKICGMTVSPLTGTILMSLMGGYFAPALRFAGIDGLAIHGKSENPIIIVVRNGSAELIPVSHLWGLTTGETEKALFEDFKNEKIQIASIGPAGEKQVAFASIMHGGHAMGRGGIGAVMGSKNIKAIVVAGNTRPSIKQPVEFKSTLSRIRAFYKESPQLDLFGVTGTTHHVNGLNNKRIYPTRNFQQNFFEGYEKVNAESLYKQFVLRRDTCYACTVRCRRESAVSTQADGKITTDGPEYETLWGFGGNCGNNQLEYVILANELCRQYGLDTISTSMTISFAMECFERGILTLEDTNGLSLNFGNAEGMIELIHRIANRQNIGNILAEGTKRASELIGKDASLYAMHVKGLELAGYEPRGAKGMGLGYATSPRGGCHERGYLLPEVVMDDPQMLRYQTIGKGELVKRTQDTVAVKDALGFCVLSSAGTSLQDLAELFSATTGLPTSEENLLLAGERICNLERIFNLRQGFRREDDTLPSRFLKEPIPGVDGKHHIVELQPMLDDYYTARGWDKNGIPQQETLTRLGLSKFSP